ncbi:MAG: hypothetical protein ACI9DG_001441, partial [Oleispira sp.]
NRMLINNIDKRPLCRTRDLYTAYPQPIPKLRVA